MRCKQEYLLKYATSSRNGDMRTVCGNDKARICRHAGRRVIARSTLNAGSYIPPVLIPSVGYFGVNRRMRLAVSGLRSIIAMRKASVWS